MNELIIWKRKEEAKNDDSRTGAEAPILGRLCIGVTSRSRGSSYISLFDNNAFKFGRPLQSVKKRKTNTQVKTLMHC